MQIQTLIADDELLARQKLRQLLRSEPDLEIAGEASSAREVCELVEATAPQLLFLDVRMPDMDSLDVITELSSRTSRKLPRIVLTTAYDQYALRAFELNATDYLLKPFSADRLHTAVSRAREQIRGEERNGERNRPEGTTAEQYAARIVFRSRGRILFLPVSDIRWISAEENYVRICTGTETHLLRETMTSMEQRLDPHLFLRVHRSAIVNLRYVKEVRSEARGDFVVHLVNGEKLAMSRSYRTRISGLLDRGN